MVDVFCSWMEFLFTFREELNIAKADLKSKTDEVKAKTADIEEKNKISNQVRIENPPPPPQSLNYPTDIKKQLTAFHVLK